MSNWVDVVLLAGLLLVAITGWRAGVITTSASFAGFIGGALAGAWVVPHLIADSAWPTFMQAMATLAGMFVLGVLGQTILGFGGRMVRDAVDFQPIRIVDSVSGMVVSILAFLLCSWMVLSVAASSSLGSASEQVRTSRGFPLLDQVMAGPGGSLLDDARELLATIDVPSLPFNPATLPPVGDPQDVDVSPAAAKVARSSVVQVSTTSTGVVRPRWVRVWWWGPSASPPTPTWWLVRVGSPCARSRSEPRGAPGSSCSTRPPTWPSCTCPDLSRRPLTGSPMQHAVPMPWSPAIRAVAA